MLTLYELSKISCGEGYEFTIKRRINWFSDATYEIAHTNYHDGNLDGAYSTRAETIVTPVLKEAIKAFIRMIKANVNKREWPVELFKTMPL